MKKSIPKVRERESEASILGNDREREFPLTPGVIGQFLFFGLYFSIVGQSVGSFVCKVFVLCLTPTLSSVLCFCVILSVMSNILFSSSVSEAYVFVSSLSLHQVLGCYSIPLNISTIFSVSIESTQSCSVLSSNILQLL